MKIGISSWAYPWAVGVPGSEPLNPMTPEQLLGRAKELDVEVVQIADNMPLDSLGDEELERLLYTATQLGLELEVGTCGFAPEHLKTYLEIARKLGSAFLRVVVDSPGHQPDNDEIMSTLRQVLPIAEQYGIDLLIENHDRLTADGLRSILGAAGSERIGIVLDTINSLGTFETVEHVLNVLAPWVRNVHVKDVTISRLGHKMGFLVEGAPAGSGDLNLDLLFNSIAQLEQDVNLILEQWPSPAESIDESIRREADWATASVSYLKDRVKS
jgi:sugar phosphate isomerase/epimerase